MIKRLLFLLIALSAFSWVRAQTSTDSAKTVIADSTVKKQLIETVKDLPTDSVLRKRHADTLVKHTADSIARIHADSLAKMRPADSIAKQAAIDTVAQKPVAGPPQVAKSVKVKIVDSATISVPVVTLRRSTKKDSIVHPTMVKTLVPVPPAADAVKHSPIKSLSDKKYLGYLNGDDMDDMSLAAELNHYPMPDKALKYKVQLGLNPGQLSQLKTIVTNLNRKKKEMGGNIINNERTLDTLFKSHQIVDGTIIFYTNRYGLYLGELRNAILQACFQTRDILSEAQIKKLETLEKAGQ